MLGNAKLLPPVVPVKRETQQVVSLAMTGLVRDAGHVFHIEETRRLVKRSAFTSGRSATGRCERAEGICGERGTVDRAGLEAERRADSVLVLR